MKLLQFTRTQIAFTILLGTPVSLVLSGCASQSKKNPGLYSGGLSAITENSAVSDGGGTAMGGVKPPQKTSAADRLMSPLRQAKQKRSRTKEYGEDPLSLTNNTEAPSADLFLAAARVIASSGNYENAKAMYHDALNAFPTHREGMLELARIHVQLQEFDEATELYMRVVEAHPSDPIVFNDVAMYHMEQGRPELAIKSFQRAVELEPEKALYRNNLANAYVKQNQPQLAMRELSSVHPESIAHFNLGYLLYNNRQLGDSIAEFDRSFQADSQNYDAYVMRMKVAEELQRLEQTQQGLRPVSPAAFQNPQRNAGTIRQLSATVEVEPATAAASGKEVVEKIPAATPATYEETIHVEPVTIQSESARAEPSKSAAMQEQTVVVKQAAPSTSTPSRVSLNDRTVTRIASYPTTGEPKLKQESNAPSTEARREMRPLEDFLSSDEK